MNLIHRNKIKKASEVIVALLLANCIGATVSNQRIDQELINKGLSSDLKFFAAKADPRLSIMVNDDIATITLA